MSASLDLHDRRAKRRHDALPYAPRRPRRSTRLGGAASPDLDSDDDDLDRAPAASAAARGPSDAAGGLFSRLFSFFPLGGKKTTAAVDEPKDDAMSVERSDEDENAVLNDVDDDVEEVITPMVVEVATAAPVTKPSATANGHATSPVKASRSPPSKRTSSAAVIKTQAAEPALHVTEKMPVAAASSVFGNGTDKTKTLKIANGDADKEQQFAFRRTAGRRRSKPSSPAVTESPLAVIKKKKPISFEEYERLSSQLRNLVEQTPDNALALTRSALTNALEGRGQSDAAAAAKENGRDRRELSVAALPSAKRARPSDEMPIALPREDRLVRKPKPSRLLTGARRDAASRSAYSAAVAEKILSTLNKLQTPLDKESQKPTPSTSLSWAKHQLALSNQDGDKLDQNMDAEEELPPTASIPKVAWKPVVAEVAATSTQAVAKNASFTFAQPNGVTKNSPVLRAAASPAAIAQPSKNVVHSTPVVATSSASTTLKMSEYSFTLPYATAPLSKSADDERSIQFFFTPPPALREPPKRSPGQKAMGAKAGSSTAPFSFMPASPRMRPESLTKSVPPKPKSPVVSAPVVSQRTTSAPSSAANPLARFMQVEEGSWKCPTCAVTNGVKYAKCPCCDTDKPAASGAKPAPTTGSTSTIPAATNPLARFMQVEEGSWKCPTCAVTNGIKYVKCPCCDTDKPGAMSASTEKKSSSAAASAAATSSGAFTFGVAPSEPKKTEAAVTTGGFKFGAPTAETKPAAALSSGFSFGVSSSANKTTTAPPASGFTFGSAAKPIADSSTSPAAPKPCAGGFTFGSTTGSEELKSSNKRKPSDENAGEPSEKKQATSTTGSFSFGASTASATNSGSFSFGASTSTATTEEKPKSAGFTFGTTAAPSSTPAVAEPVAKKAAFSFGTSETLSPPQKPAVPSFLSASATTKLSSEEKKGGVTSIGFGTSAPAFGATANVLEPKKPASAKPAFSFGSSTPEPKTTDSLPPKASFGFTPIPDSGVTEAKTGFTFGNAPATGAPFGSKASDATSSSSKPFAFGQSADASNASGKHSPFELGASTSASSALVQKPSVSFGVGSSTATSTTASTPAFSFGASSADSSAKKADAPAFSFGGSSQAAPAFSAGSSSFGADKPSGNAFGQSTAGFGSTAATASGFGSGSTGFGASTSTTSSGFGATTSSAFGSATSTGFGSTASSGFGTSTSVGFGSSSSAGFGASSTSTAFGSTPAGTPAPAFGNTLASTPSAPAFAFGASTPATSQSAFGFKAPTSSAFSTPSTDVFGASNPSSGFGAPPSSSGFGSSAPTPAFGVSPAPAFGATPAPSPAFGSSGNSSGFGSSAFGSSAPSGAFGAPTPTPSPAFGGSSSTFGTPSTGFGTPAPAFGAMPSPAPSAAFGAPSPAFGAPATPSFGAPPTPQFGAPSAGGFGAAAAPAFGAAAGAVDGFSMGAAPPKGRRILKAKSRSKR